MCAPAVAERLDPLLEAGLVARCTPTDLEAGFSSLSPADHRFMRSERASWPFVAMDQRVLDRAVEVQDVLAARSAQRGAKIADLLIAAAAESAGLVVLHYDGDFERTAAITGQDVEWVVPPGAVPWVLLDLTRHPAIWRGIERTPTRRYALPPTGELCRHAPSPVEQQWNGGIACDRR